MFIYKYQNIFTGCIKDFFRLISKKRGLTMKTHKTVKNNEEYKLSVRLPGNFYLLFSKMKEDAFKQGHKIFTNDVIVDALNMYFKSLGYEISDD
jgi:hypothetical protein